MIFAIITRTTLINTLATQLCICASRLLHEWNIVPQMDLLLAVLMDLRLFYRLGLRLEL